VIAKTQAWRTLNRKATICTDLAQIYAKLVAKLLQHLIAARKATCRIVANPDDRLSNFVPIEHAVKIDHPVDIRQGDFQDSSDLCCYLPGEVTVDTLGGMQGWQQGSAPLVGYSFQRVMQRDEI
jgi:hypothetical protein